MDLSLRGSVLASPAQLFSFSPIFDIMPISLPWDTYIYHSVKYMQVLPGTISRLRTTQPRQFHSFSRVCAPVLPTCRRPPEGNSGSENKTWNLRKFSGIPIQMHRTRAYANFHKLKWLGSQAITHSFVVAHCNVAHVQPEWPLVPIRWSVIN